jgi:ferredoxin-thioredoxin reductase catalytic subunit
MYGKKNGYLLTYDYNNLINGTGKGILISKELYIDDKKEGKSFYYYNDGKIKSEVSYLGGKKQGLTKEYEEYAAENGFSLNPQRKIVEGIVKSLLERDEQCGQRYCPCRRITGDKEEDKKIICPCVFHLAEIEKDGHCHCGLFVKA